MDDSGGVEGLKYGLFGSTGSNYNKIKIKGCFVDSVGVSLESQGNGSLGGMAGWPYREEFSLLPLLKRGIQ